MPCESNDDWNAGARGDEHDDSADENEENGYYDDDGNFVYWEEVGYYDDDGEFLYYDDEGYYDEDGTWCYYDEVPDFDEFDNGGARPVLSTKTVKPADSVAAGDASKAANPEWWAKYRKYVLTRFEVR